MRYRRLALVIALSFAGTALPASADPPGSRWIVTASAVGLSPSGDEARGTLPEGDGRFDLSAGNGFGLALDYRFAKRWGIGVTVRAANLDSRFRLSGPEGTLVADDSMRFELFGIGGSYRVLVKERFDLYVEGAIVMSKGADQIFTTGPEGRVKLTFDDDIGYELTVGTDIRLGASERWLLRGGLGYLVTILETDSGFGDVDLDPWTLRIGVGYGF